MMRTNCPIRKVRTRQESESDSNEEPGINCYYKHLYNYFRSHFQFCPTTLDLSLRRKKILCCDDIWRGKFSLKTGSHKSHFATGDTILLVLPSF